MKKVYNLLSIIVISTFLYGCSAYDAITNVQRLQFKLGGVSGMKVANIDLSKVKNLSSVNPLDLIKLTSAYSSGSLPVNFTLDLIAKNPNDGTGGTANTSAFIKSLDWRLLIDDKETISGNIGNSIEIPGVGKSTTIPITINLDLLQFFKGEGMNNLINLMTSIGGASGSSSRLALKIRPTVDTFLGPITYPGEITVVDKEFRNQ